MDSSAVFRVPVDVDAMLRLLQGCYLAVVGNSGRRQVACAELDEALRRVALALTDPEPRPGIMLMGLCGNGKTSTLLAVQQAINWLRDAGVFGTRAADARITIRAARDVAKLRPSDPEYIALLRRPMLAIDDLGVEPTEVLDYGNINTPLAELLEARYSGRLYTLVSTNLRPQELSRKYGVRLADRFKEMFTQVVYTNSSFRNLNPDGTPLTPPKPPQK